MVSRARAAAAEGARVAYLGRSPQRGEVMRALARGGPTLGVAFYTFQQFALLMLSRAGGLGAQILPTARLALVAEALSERSRVPPTPGEASLFTRAIAEVKRSGFTSERLAELAAVQRSRNDRGAGELERLAAVLARYEELKGPQLDDDDVRAAVLSEAQRRDDDALRAIIPADLLIVDGLAEVAPDDLAWFRELARAIDVEVSVEQAPAGVVAEQLPPRENEVHAYRFANPVAEVRWLLRAVARDLGEGFDPRDLAVIAPSNLAAALLALAPEFDVPLARQAPRALVDLPFGRLLVDLLELPEHPNAGRLLAVPELLKLGQRAFEERLSGARAVERLAFELDLAERWNAWREALTPSEPVLDWARQLVALAADLDLAQTPSEQRAEQETRIAQQQEAALRRAQEAARLAVGEGFRDWWLALLRASVVAERSLPGVALIEPHAAAGRRFRRAYLAGAVAGAYDVGEHEDVFIPEELRALGPDLTPFELPRRHRGADARWRIALRARADRLTITHALADREQMLRPDTLLLAAELGEEPPELPTVSPLEVLAEGPYSSELPTIADGAVSLQTLQRAELCPFAAWGEAQLPEAASADWLTRARRTLREAGAWSPERSERLQRAFPLLQGWLEAHTATLGGLKTGVRFEEGGTSARIDAVARDGAHVKLFAFLLPDESPAALLRPAERWRELWVADHLLRRYPSQVVRVDILAWPIGAEAELLTPVGVDTPALQAARQRVHGFARVAAERWRAGPPEPKPGFECRSCRIADFCRMGALS